jgi:cytochrome c553
MTKPLVAAVRLVLFSSRYAVAEAAAAAAAAGTASKGRRRWVAKACRTCHG